MYMRVRIYIYRENFVTLVNRPPLRPVFSRAKGCNKVLKSLLHLKRRIFMLESRIEKRLKYKIERLGGKAIKFVSPGMSGVPDRIVMLPGGRLYFVELKAPGKKMMAIQEYRAREFEKLGFTVKCLDTTEKVDSFVKEAADEI